MAQIPSFKRVIRENFPSDVKWLSRLLDPINSFMEDITLAFHNRLTIAENMDAEIRVVTVGGSYPVQFSWGRASKPTIGLIGKIERTDGTDVSLSSAISLNWTYTQKGEISIDDVVGLDDASDKKYNLRLVFFVN